jgi:hypothetical protein
VKRSGRAFTTTLLAGAFWIGLVPPGDAQQPIRIGSSLSQSGPNAAQGQNHLRGRQLCVKDTNEKGGVLGRRIELIVEDDQSKAPTAVAIYEKLITEDKVDAILGPYGAPIVEAVADVSEKHRMPMVSPSGTVTSISRGRPARRVAGQREAPRRHSEDGPQHRLRRIPGRMNSIAQGGHRPGAGDLWCTRCSPCSSGASTFAAVCSGDLVR